MRIKQKNALDVFRIVVAMLVIANHTSPLAGFNQDIDFILTRVLARIAVPFFFILTGYFVLGRKNETQVVRNQRIVHTCLHLCKLYGLCILLYLPINYYASNLDMSLTGLLKSIFFNGTFYHLWYFPAVISGVLLVHEMMKVMKDKTLLIVTGLLYLIALGGDGYFGLFTHVDWIENIYNQLFLIFHYTRNGLLFAPLFLSLGAVMANARMKLERNQSTYGFILFFALMVAEAMTIRNAGFQRHDSMYLMLVPAMIFLFQILLGKGGEQKRSYRQIAMVIYVIHPMVILLVRMVGKIGTLKTILVDNQLVLYFLVTFISYVIAWFLVWAHERTKPMYPSKTGRAWIEISLQNLQHNLLQIQSLIKKETKVMAVVKADGYGHGAVTIAGELERLGVDMFAVATLEEAIQLRESCITSDILILGYTDPKEVPCLLHYNLIQTVVDENHAQRLNEIGKLIRVHMKLDTGMHRLGVDFEKTEVLLSLYNMKNLKIEGIYTHLSCSNSLDHESEKISYLQIKRFYDQIDHLKEEGINLGKTHIQSSYGLVNYPELRCDYVRIGDALYGVMDDKKMKAEMNLYPVLSLKARIASIRWVLAEEGIGYGQKNQSQHKKRIATVTLGYSDGLMRNSQNQSYLVLIQGQYAKTVGLLCMDQCMVDITDLKGIEVHDIVTFIGEDQGIISVKEITDTYNTIPSEVLSQLGIRLKRIVKSSVHR